MSTVVESPTNTKASAKDTTGWATNPDDLKAVRDAYAQLRHQQGGAK